MYTVFQKDDLFCEEHTTSSLREAIELVIWFKSMGFSSSYFFKESN